VEAAGHSALLLGSNRLPFAQLQIANLLHQVQHAWFVYICIKFGEAGTTVFYEIVAHAEIVAYGPEGWK
jgi:hypothetical protein